MDQIVGRLTALDPDAAAALSAVAYFDELVSKHAGLEAVVRGAAVLSGAAARLHTPGRVVPLRVLSDGHRLDEDAPPDASWQCQSIPGMDVTMWLERPGPAGPVDAMVLERGTQAACIILERTRGYQPAARRDDRALLEVLLDPAAPESARANAAQALGFRRGQTVRVVAEAGSPLRIEPAAAGKAGTEAVPAARCQPTGVGPIVAVEQASSSAQAATLALRLCADGTPSDPGPRILMADDLGALLLIAQAFDHDPGWQNHPDLTMVQGACARVSWLLPTLSAVATTDSLRAASAALVIHHSTLQKRLTQAGKLLGWDITTPLGKLRAQVALVLYRLAASRV